jgi:endonuclease G, mitochondrial
MIAGEEFRKLYDGLRDRFQNWDDLRVFVRANLGENLNHIAGGNNLSDAIFHLIEWADSRGRLDELKEGAITQK